MFIEVKSGVVWLGQIKPGCFWLVQLMIGYAGHARLG